MVKEQKARERERERWWAVRKRGHGCHAPRVKPTINREVKLLRYSLVHRSLAFARKSLHLSLCAEQPCPTRSVGNISAEYIRSLVFFSFFFFSPSKFSPPRIYHAIRRDEGTRIDLETWNRIPSWQNWRCGQRINDEPIKKR